MQRRAVVARLAHNQEVAGSSPAAATNFWEGHSAEGNAGATERAVEPSCITQARRTVSRSYRAPVAAGGCSPLGTRMTHKKLLRRTLKPGCFSVIPDDVLFDLELSTEARLLYMYVYRRSYKIGCCRLSNSVLAKFLGCSLRSVTRYLDQLCEQKHLVRLGGRRHQRLVPAINLECLPDLLSDTSGRLDSLSDTHGRLELIPIQTLVADKKKLIGHGCPNRPVLSDTSGRPIETIKKTYTENRALPSSFHSSRGSPRPPRARSGLKDQILAEVTELRRQRDHVEP